MKEIFEFRLTAGNTARKWMRRFAATSLEASKRGIALVLVGLMIPMGIAQVSAFAQDAPPPPPPPDQQQGPPPDDNAAPPQQWNALSPDQLNQLVAPIALYPDSLVAQVLAASTYPTQVVEADRFVQSQGGAPPDQIAQEVNGQNWDPSVKALCAFPSVLANMDKNLDWTTQLGNAYYNQPQDVMNAVQGLRQQAYSAGHLQSSQQLAVTYAPGDIVDRSRRIRLWCMCRTTIRGRTGDSVRTTRGMRLRRRLDGGPASGSASASALPLARGAATAGAGDTGASGGARTRTSRYGHGAWVSRSVTVVNHGYYGRFDRAPGARAYNVQAAHTAYGRGYAAGAHNGYNRGAANGYNRGALRTTIGVAGRITTTIGRRITTIGRRHE